MEKIVFLDCESTGMTWLCVDISTPLAFVGWMNHGPQILFFRIKALKMKVDFLKKQFLVKQSNILMAYLMNEIEMPPYLIHTMAATPIKKISNFKIGCKYS